MNSSSRNTAQTRFLSLAEGQSLLTIYETMVETARTHDWDRLAEIEHQAATLRDKAIARPISPVDAEDVDELAELLARIQRLDREIRTLLEPAHEQARQQLAAEVKGRTVREAYGNVEAPDSRE